MSDDIVKDTLIRFLAELDYYFVGDDRYPGQGDGFDICREWMALAEECGKGSDGHDYWRGLRQGMFSCVDIMAHNPVESNFTERLEDIAPWFRRHLYE